MLKSKSSKYNFYFKDGDNYFVHNQMTRTLMVVDKELYYALLENNICNIPDDIVQYLTSDGYICDLDLKEENVLLLENHLFRYGNRTVRVTIMPTLNCNFSCWYCYENHHSGCISDEALSSIYSFCSTLIKSRNFIEFRLDWFGGEPMMYFKKAIVPLSSRLKKLCVSEHVSFVNSITTNGYLFKNDYIEELNNINLNVYQITLDGCKEYHNQTRFTLKDHDTYSRLTENIIMLCRNVKDIDLTLRINYTPSNIDTIDQIVNDFPDDVRSKINVIPQLVWQFKKGLNPQAGLIKEKMQVFKMKGYKVPRPSVRRNYCYVESMSQFVINYDLNVYKCTARDFQPKHSVGYLTQDGIFIPSAHYYDYCIPSQMERKECMDCKLLPSCLSSCIQKTIEGNHTCYKTQVEEELKDKILLMIKDIEQ